MASLYRWVIAALILGFAGHSDAAYTQILWDWTQGSGGSIDGFHVKCGRSTTSYTVTITVNDSTARSVSIYTATNNQRGQWYCTVDAFSNSNGTSSNGNEVNFVLPFFGDPRGSGGFGGF